MHPPKGAAWSIPQFAHFGGILSLEWQSMEKGLTAQFKNLGNKSQIIEVYPSPLRKLHLFILLLLLNISFLIRM